MRHSFDEIVDVSTINDGFEKFANLNFDKQINKENEPTTDKFTHTTTTTTTTEGLQMAYLCNYFLICWKFVAVRARLTEGQNDSSFINIIYITINHNVHIGRAGHCLKKE